MVLLGDFLNCEFKILSASQASWSPPSTITKPVSQRTTEKVANYFVTESLCKRLIYLIRYFCNIAVLKWQVCRNTVYILYLTMGLVFSLQDYSQSKEAMPIPSECMNCKSLPVCSRSYLYKWKSGSFHSPKREFEKCCPSDACHDKGLNK